MICYGLTDRGNKGGRGEEGVKGEGMKEGGEEGGVWELATVYSIYPGSVNEEGRFRESEAVGSVLVMIDGSRA